MLNTYVTLFFHVSKLIIHFHGGQIGKILSHKWEQLLGSKKEEKIFDILDL